MYKQSIERLKSLLNTVKKNSSTTGIRSEINELVDESKERILLNINDFKAMSWQNIRKVMPWHLIFLKLGIINLFKVFFSEFLRKIGRSNTKFELSGDSLEQIYKITFLYYLNPVFKELNNRIKRSFNAQGMGYKYIFPHRHLLFDFDGILLKDEQSSVETKRWARINKYLLVIKVLAYGFAIFQLLDFFKIVNLTNIIAAVIAFAFAHVMDIFGKVGSGNSVLKDKVASNIYKMNQQTEKPVEGEVEEILDYFRINLDTQLETSVSLIQHWFKKAIVSIVLILMFLSTVVLAYVLSATGENSAQTSEELSHGQVETSIPTEKALILLFDTRDSVELSVSNFPAARIVFNKDIGIIGNIGSARGKFLIDNTTIEVNRISDGEISLEASLSTVISIQDWSAKSGILDFGDPNDKLKERLSTQLGETVLRLYLSQNEVNNKYDNEIKNAEIKAKSYIEDTIKRKYPNVKINTLINYLEPTIDLSGTPLR